MNQEFIPHRPARWPTLGSAEDQQLRRIADELLRKGEIDGGLPIYDPKQAS